MKLTYTAEDICEIVRRHVTEHGPTGAARISSPELVVRDDDGLLMTDDCTVSVEIEIGPVHVDQSEDV